MKTKITKLLPALAIIVLIVGVLVLTNRRLTGISQPVFAQEEKEPIRSAAPSIQVDSITRTKVQGTPLNEITLRNIGKSPVAYVWIRKDLEGRSSTQLNFMTGEISFGAGETYVLTIDAEVRGVIAGVSFGDGTVEGEPLGIKLASFFHDDFLATSERYAATLAQAHDENASPETATDRLLAQVESEGNVQRYQTSGSSWFTHVLENTLRDTGSSLSQSGKIDLLLRQFQHTRLNARAKMGAQ